MAQNTCADCGAGCDRKAMRCQACYKSQFTPTICLDCGAPRDRLHNGKLDSRCRRCRRRNTCRCGGQKLRKAKQCITCYLASQPPPKPKPVPRQRKERWLAHGYVMLPIKDHLLSYKGGTIAEHRLVLFDAIGYGPHRCHWCDTHINWRYGLEVDHLNAGKADNRPENLVQSCRGCNLQREHDLDYFSPLRTDRAAWARRPHGG